MAERPITKTWQPVDTITVAKNYTQDITGTNRRMGHKASVINSLIEALNHLLAQHMRPIFWNSQGYPTSTGLGWSQQAEDPLYFFKYPDVMHNERTWVYRVLMVPPATGSGASKAHRQGASSTATLEEDFVAGSAQNLDAVQYREFEYSRGDRANSEITEGITTLNDYIVVDCVIQARELSTLNDTNHQYVFPGAAPGDYVVGNTWLEQLRAKLHTSRTTNLGKVLSWCSTDIGNTAITASDTRGFYVASTSFVNLLDQTVTARSATSPGFFFHTEYGAMGLLSPTGGTVTQKKYTFRLYADVAGASTATVRFETALGTADITINNTGAAWYGSDSNYFVASSNVADSETGATINKCDILAKVASGGDILRIWAIEAWEII